MSCDNRHFHPYHIITIIPDNKEYFLDLIHRNIYISGIDDQHAPYSNSHSSIIPFDPKDIMPTVQLAHAHTNNMATHIDDEADTYNGISGLLFKAYDSDASDDDSDWFFDASAHG